MPFEAQPRIPGKAAALLAAVFALLLALLLVACGGDDAPAEPAGGGPAASSAAASVTGAGSPGAAAATFPLTYTDSAGTKVTLKEAPKRIISYSPGATEVLFAVGAGGQVVAADQFSDYPAAAKALPKVEYSNPSPEPAVAFKPDLVIMAGRQEGQVAQFRSLGMTVILLREPENVDGVVAQVRALGQLAGKATEADALAAAMQQRIDKVKASAATQTSSPTVFWELSADLFTVGPNTFIGSMLTLLKARNVAEGQATAFPQLSPEAVIKANPAVVILADGGDQGGQSAETVKARPGWPNIDAVKQGRVHVVDSDIFSRPGPRVVDALEQLAPLLYPAR